MFRPVNRKKRNITICMEIYTKCLLVHTILLIKQIQFSLYLADNVDLFGYCMECGHTHEVDAIYCWKLYLLTLVNL